ncbi:MAG TPA: homoserine dehydrogenase [Ruminococcaceae bacterium]|nr:homoserine dehydrogenase [Oscillospiraceae bacterium]
MIYIAVMGHGVVGSGVVEVFYKNLENLSAKCGSEMDIKYILDIRDFPDSPYKDKFTKSFDDILNDSDISIVVEVMGGLEPAYSFVKRCLLAGKSVVTSNKELVAMKGFELLSLSRDNNVNFLFEASVGGGIPVIRPIAQCLAANDITEIAGILNGTTNFIMTKMIKDQMSFKDALCLAQSLGYAECDPSADVEGDDTCRKICILASLAFGKHVYPRQVFTQGITGIHLEDVSYAESLGHAIKLIGRAVRLYDGHLSVTVYPALISKDCQLASVDDVFNAIMVRGDATGDVVFYGKGAGKLPTASAVIADVMDCVKHISARKYLYWQDGEDGYVADYRLDEHAFYVRGTSQIDVTSAMLGGLVAGASAEVLDKIRETFGTVRFVGRQDANDGEIVFITGVMREAAFTQALDRLKDFLNPESVLRVMDY